ncbi:MAG: arginine--tRNA ligase [Acidobacteriota bacterium]|nr:arginine--tRNA ligase [Acidobacteriota bacterium]
MSHKETIGVLLTDILTGPLGVSADQLEDPAGWIEEPKDKKMGDLAFPCFRLARVLRKKPNLIAADIMEHLEARVAETAGITGVNAVGPYLNFTLDRAALAADLIPAVLDGSFLARRPDKGEKVMIEYSQPNTHKAFHVGHTRNVALGASLAHIFEWNGFEVVPVNYIGDEGAHIAKCLWYYRTYFDGNIPDTNLGEFLGELYTQATLKLDFNLLTRCPMPKVSVARVAEIADFPDNPKLKIVQVDTGEKTVQVVCGGTGYKQGDKVAYAHIGSRVNGRQVGEISKNGVPSKGMILSELEMGLSDDKMQLKIFPDDAPVGLPVAEYMRTDALPADVSVLEEMERRNHGVAETLKLLEARDPEVYALFEKTKKWSMDEFHAIYDWLGAPFEHYFFESDVGGEGKKKVLEYLEKGVLVKSEGAVGADLSEFNLPFLLLLKSNGSGLYSTKDIALAHEKFDRFGVDRSIYVVDVGQSLHFQQVFATLLKMGYQRAKKCYHLAYGIVMLPGEEPGAPPRKMSSRDGTVILFSELRRQLVETVTAVHLEESYRGVWSDEEIREAAEVVAKSTINYGMLNQDNGKDIVFDMEAWTSASGNTGPYMLYAYARTRNILAKLGDFDRNSADWSLLTHETEQDLVATMEKFHKVAERAAREYRPQVICLYLFDLCKSFSSFYNHCSVLRAETPELQATRALLVDAVGRVIKKGLDLLGIETLERI